jgi:hypothetical protein
LSANNGIETIPCIPVPVFEVISGKMLAGSYDFLIRLGIKASLEPGDQLFDI